MTALVIAEHDNASIKGATLNTVAAAAQCGGEVHLLVAGSNAAAAAAAAARIAGVSKVIHADGEQFAHGLAENVAAQVLAIASAYSHLVFPATAAGKNVAPRVAAKLDVAQISDVIKVLAADTFERPSSSLMRFSYWVATSAIKIHKSRSISAIVVLSTEPGSCSERAHPSAACASSTAPLSSMAAASLLIRPPNKSPVVPSSPLRV